MSSNHTFVAIDAGASKSRVARFVYNNGWQMTDRSEATTPSQYGPEAVIATLLGLVETVKHPFGHLDALSVSFPGIIDHNTGMVHLASRLHSFTDIPLGQRLSDRLGLPVHIGNDGDLATLGEAQFGAGRGTRNMIRINVGSGIAFGAMQNHMLLRDAGGASTEIGCIQVSFDSVLPCTRCGGKRCLRMITPGNAMEESITHLLQSGRHSVLSAHAELTVPLIAGAAAAGDELAQVTIQRAVKALTEVIPGLAFRYNTNTCIIGGGVANLQSQFIAPLALAVGRDVTIAPSSLGDDVGLYGALSQAVALHGIETTHQSPPLPAISLERALAHG